MESKQASARIAYAVKVSCLSCLMSLSYEPYVPCMFFLRQSSGLHWRDEGARESSVVKMHNRIRIDVWSGKLTFAHVSRPWVWVQARFVISKKMATETSARL